MFQQVEFHKDKFLPISHPASERVINVVNRLLKSNTDIPQLHHTKWNVSVVDEPSIINAIAFPVSHLIFPAHGAEILMFNAYTHILCRVVGAGWLTRNIQRLDTK
jgi:hypothetical protein